MGTKNNIPLSAPKQMNDSWHIPRASLAGSSVPPSSNSSSKSSLSRVSKNLRPSNSHSSNRILDVDWNRVQAYQDKVVNGEIRAEKESRSSNRNTIKSQTKRGSRSSQGSNDSTQSASSGSMLLTVANLERFAEIHSQQNKSYVDRKNEFLRSNYNFNLLLVSNQSHLSKDAVVSIEPNLNFIKTKDADTMSVASSTHFTMVNGEGGPSRKATGGICSRGKQVTVLIVSMSLFFLVVILGMVYALELRARDMPKS